MKTVLRSISASHPDQADIAAAAAHIAAGDLVAMPTETVYGLAADAHNPAAVARITTNRSYTTKSIPTKWVGANDWAKPYTASMANPLKDIIAYFDH